MYCRSCNGGGAVRPPGQKKGPDFSSGHVPSLRPGMHALRIPYNAYPCKVTGGNRGGNCIHALPALYFRSIPGQDQGADGGTLPVCHYRRDPVRILCECLAVKCTFRNNLSPAVFTACNLRRGVAFHVRL